MFVFPRDSERGKLEFQEYRQQFLGDIFFDI